MPPQKPPDDFGVLANVFSPGKILFFTT